MRNRKNYRFIKNLIYKYKKTKSKKKKVQMLLKIFFQIFLEFAKQKSRKTIKKISKILKKYLNPLANTLKMKKTKQTSVRNLVWIKLLNKEGQKEKKPLNRFNILTENISHSH